MKNRLLFIFCFTALVSKSQEIFNISPGTNVFFGTNTLVSANDLTLIPSSSVTLSNVALSRSTAVTFAGQNINIARVYHFTNAVEGFNGSVNIKYEDSELYGISEADLRLNIHNGTTWTYFATSTNDGVGNTVLTASISNQALQELTLSAASMTLPLRWNDIKAYRESKTVKIKWKTLNEYNITHFNVERAMDGRSWKNVSSNIPAFNSLVNNYEHIDRLYENQQLFYRVKQFDIDGKVSYSRIVSVEAENNNHLFTLFPNPAIDHFRISGDATALIKIELYNSLGSLVKHWKEPQEKYFIRELPAGVYSVRLFKRDGSRQTLQIQKK